MQPPRSCLLVALGPARAITLAGSWEEGAAGVTVCILAVCASESGAPPQFTRPQYKSAKDDPTERLQTKKFPPRSRGFFHFDCFHAFSLRGVHCFHSQDSRFGSMSFVEGESHFDSPQRALRPSIAPSTPGYENDDMVRSECVL